MNEQFAPNRPLSAAALNRLADSSAAAHVGAGGYLTAENGHEQVVRNPRRTVAARAVSNLIDRSLYIFTVGANQSGGPGGIGGMAYAPEEYPDGGVAATVYLSDCTWGDAPPEGTVLLAHSLLLSYSPSASTAAELGQEE